MAGTAVIGGVPEKRCRWYRQFDRRWTERQPELIGKNGFHMVAAPAVWQHAGRFWRPAKVILSSPNTYGDALATVQISRRSQLEPAEAETSKKKAKDHREDAGTDIPFGLV